MIRDYYDGRRVQAGGLVYEKEPQVLRRAAAEWFRQAQRAARQGHEEVTRYRLRVSRALASLAWDIAKRRPNP